MELAENSRRNMFPSNSRDRSGSPGCSERHTHSSAQQPEQRHSSVHSRREKQLQMLQLASLRGLSSFQLGWILLHIVHSMMPQCCTGLAPPPHLRACPGPLDQGSTQYCGLRGNVSFAQSSVLVELAEGSAKISVQRALGFAFKGAVQYHVVNASAFSGIDFISTSGELRWTPSDGQAKVIEVPFIDSGIYTPGRYITKFLIRLERPRNVALGEIREIQVSVVNSNAVTGTINMVLTEFKVGESEGVMRLNASRVGGTDCDASVSYRTVAIPGHDFGNYGSSHPDQTGSVEWLEGDGDLKSIVIPIADDQVSRPSPGEQFYVEVFNAGCADIGNSRTLVTVLDNDRVGYLKLDTPQIQIFSDAGYAVVMISRVDGSTSPLSVDYFTVDGTASAGVHYTQTRGQLVWRHGDISTKKLKIPILNGGGGTALFRTMSLKLAYVTGTTLYGNVYRSAITIYDVLAVPGKIGFELKFDCRGPPGPSSGNCYYFTERESLATLVVTRTEGVLGEISVDYVATNFTLDSYDDFLGVSGTLTWADLDTTPRYITIPILRDADLTPIVEYMQVVLTDRNPLLSTVEASRSVAYVGSIDQDGAGSITLSAVDSFVLETSEIAYFTFNRTGYGQGAISVYYETTAGSGGESRDYAFSSGNVTWQNGETGSKVVSVPLVNDYNYQYGLFFKTFSLTVFAFSRNTFVDPRKESAEVTIIDDNILTGFILFSPLSFEPLTSTVVGSAVYNLREGTPTVTLTVSRKDGFQGNLRVSFKTEDGTATRGVHYESLSGVLTWLEGDDTDRHLTITVVDNERFRPRSAFSSFYVVLYQVEIFEGSLTSAVYDGPANITAEVVVEEDDGPGILGLAQTEVQVSEGEGFVELTVSRWGGAEFPVTINYTTVAGSADAPLLEEIETGVWQQSGAFPRSCAGAGASGIRAVQGAGGVVREVYCDMSADADVGSASMFVWDLSTLLWRRECSLAEGSDGAAMWTDLGSRIAEGAGGRTNGTGFTAWVAGQGSGAVTNLTERPAQAGDFARPVAFPMNERAIWFDWENRRMVFVKHLNWTNSSGMNASNCVNALNSNYSCVNGNCSCTSDAIDGLVLVTFDDLGISGYGGMDDAANDFYFISDGISSVHVGTRQLSGGADGGAATLLSIDWETENVTWTAVPKLNMSAGEWCSPSGNDAFGHMLWTVNGRVFYRDCTASRPASGLGIVLGGPLQEPSSRAERIVLMQCPSDHFQGCEGWGLEASDISTGVDLFSGVDSSGFLHLGAWSASGTGLFSCGAGGYFGTVRTGIEFGREVADDYEPVSGGFFWGIGDRSDRFIRLPVKADGIVDGAMLETVQVHLYKAFAATLLSDVSTATITIEDVDGPGRVTVTSDNATVSERGQCCVRCDGANPDRDKMWCAGATVRRSSSRGPLCVDFETATPATNSSGVVGATPGVHFVFKNTTICWDHGEMLDMKETMKMPFHPTYDTLYKAVLLTVSSAEGRAGMPASMVSGSSFLCPDGALPNSNSTLFIEDADASPGLLSFAPSARAGNTLYNFIVTQDSAMMSVRRYGGSDADLAVSYMTEGILVNASDITTQREVPISITIADGSHGTNVFCLGNDERVTGSCVDSSTATVCDANQGVCSAVLSVQASQAVPQFEYNASGLADYRAMNGTLRWAEGDDNPRGISIPLFHPTWSAAGAIYHVFRVVLFSPVMSLTGRPASFPDALQLPDANPFGSCSPYTCKAPPTVLGRCDSHNCRDAASSEGWVVQEVNRQGGGSLRLVNTSYYIREGLPTGFVDLTVQRKGGTAGRVSVLYSTLAANVTGVAVAAWPFLEFGNITGELTWEDGDPSNKVIQVQIVDDDEYIKGRLRRAFLVRIYNATGGAEIDHARSEREVVIVDDDPTPGVVQVIETRKMVRESDGMAVVEVGRVGGDDMDIYVKYQTGFGTIWSSPDSQTLNSSAHPFLLSRQSYVCQTTIGAEVSASVFTLRRGGGIADLAFDRDNSTFWDSDASSGEKWLQISFPNCELGGVAISSYTFLTAPSGSDDGCPGAWTLQGSVDDIVWVTIDEQSGVACSVHGRRYALDADQVGYYMSYRWVFTADSRGYTGVRVYEVLVGFRDTEEEGSGLIKALVCNSGGACCVFKPGVCDSATGHTYQLLDDAAHDYTYRAGLLFWPEGDNSTRNFTIPILDDCLGCSAGSCNLVSQLQDKPLETFIATLGPASDVDIRKIRNNNASTFPYRVDAILHERFAESVITIQDDDGPGVLALWTASCGTRGGAHVEPFTTVFGTFEEGNAGECVVLETARVVSFFVSREGSARGAISVEFVVEGLDAVAGVDFEAVNGTLRWAHQDTTPKSFDVKILRTEGYDTGRYARQFRARLLGQRQFDGQVGTGGGANVRSCFREVSGVCVDPARGELVVTLLDVDSVPGTIAIDREEYPAGEQYAVDQSDLSVQIDISRLGGDDLPLTVRYETVAVSGQARPCASLASVNCEFFPDEGELQWADGDSTPRSVTLQIFHRPMRKTFETFKLRVTGNIRDSIDFCKGYTVDWQGGEDIALVEQDLWCTQEIVSEVTVTIRETGDHGFIQMHTYDWPYVVSDSDDAILLAVDRVEGSKGIVSAKFETVGYPDGGFAIANEQFIETIDSISWANQDVQPKIISVFLIAGKVPTDTIVDLVVRLTQHSSDTDLNDEKSSVRVVIKSASFRQLLTTKTITESSLVKGELNTITVNLECNTILGPGAKITISGLTGTGTDDAAALPLLGEHVSIFGGSGLWVKSTGTITLTVAAGQTFEYETAYAIKFVVQNSAGTQSPVVPQIAVSGNPGCARPTAAGSTLSCPAAVTITRAPMSGSLLSFAQSPFSSLSAVSHLCLYTECPHSPLQGARNYITVQFSPPVDLAATSTVTVTGLLGSSTPTSTLTAIVAGMTASFASEERYTSQLCVCYTPQCACEVAFEEIPPVADVRLRVQLQCNSLGWGTLGGETVYVRVGTTGELSAANGALTPPEQVCEDNCSTTHDLLDPPTDVSAHVSSTGQLFVAVHATSHVDFCGRGEYVRANVTVTWVTEAKDLVHVPAAWNQGLGTLTLPVPTDYTMTNGEMINVTFPLHNPRTSSSGRTLSMEGTSAAATPVGVTAIAGTVMVTTDAPKLSYASISESTQVQGKLNSLMLRLETNAVHGGVSGGVLVTLGGLRGAAINSDDAILAIQDCERCAVSASQKLPLREYAGDPRDATHGKLSWDAETGTITVLLRGQGPTYLIEEGLFIGVVTVTNSDTAQRRGPILRVHVAGELVAGSGELVAQPLHSGGVHRHQPILQANVSVLELFEGSMALSDSTGYVSPEQIRLSVTTVNGMQPTDETTWRLPGLTTCLTLFDNSSNCSDISWLYLDAPNGSDIAGMARNALLARWDEAARQLFVVVQGGRAVCPGSNALVEISPNDHECEEYTCGLKALPLVTELERGESWVQTDGLDCGAAQNPFCNNPQVIGIGRPKVRPYPGTFWGQTAGRLDVGLAGEAGRAWFSAAVHRDRVIVLGGVGPLGFANVSRVSSDGETWSDLASSAETLGHRGWFPTVSHENFLWVFGGQRTAANSSLNDVWRSETGAEWCLVTSSATWAARHRHAAVSFQDRLWVLGGRPASSTQNLADVWWSDDGGTWGIATRSAAFAARAGHASATHAGRMWVYGGDDAGADVWASVDGVTWLLSTVNAGWAPRNIDYGLAFDGRIWVVGGYNVSTAMTDVWWSADGADWTRSTATAQWGQRFGARSVAFENRMWVLGGASDGSCMDGEVTSCPTAGEGVGCDGVYTRCNGADVWLDSFSNIRFLTLEARASSNVFSAENSIYFNVTLDSDLDPGSVIVLSGLGDVASLPAELIVSGPSSPVFGGLAILDGASGNATLSVMLPVLAGSAMTFSVTVRNSPNAHSGAAVFFTVHSVGDKFATTRGSAWTWVLAAEEGGVHTVEASAGPDEDTSVWDGGVMLDVVAKRAILVDTLRVGLPQQQAGRLSQVIAEVYYKPGEHLDGRWNLSEWRSLGSVVVPVGEADREVTVRISDLVRGVDSAAVGREATCEAANSLCEMECSETECECVADINNRVSFNALTDTFPFDYAPYTFCVNQTYCSYDNNDTGYCVCTEADQFQCAAAEDVPFSWLGPQPRWTENTSEYMSTTLVRNVNISGVLAQSPNGMWHSGLGGGQEAGCVHLPKCPDEWPYDMDQWLAFDMGTQYTMAGFRTLYPSFADVPEYFFMGVKRNNIDANDWAQGQFQRFELQTSSRGLQGPWVSVLRGTGEQSGDGVWQEFTLEPATSRYWRLLMLDNYGFGYMALKGIEFYGSPSIWKTQSEWCQRSLLCKPQTHDPVSLTLDSAGNIRPFGLQLSTGTHSFFLRTNIGVAVADTSGRRGDVQADDGGVAIKVGSRFEGKVPDFAWETGGEASAVMYSVDPQDATANVINDASGFVLVVRFRMGDVGNNGTLVSIGDGDSGPLTVRVDKGTLQIAQGTELLTLSGSNGNAILVESAEYCLSAEFLAGRVRARLQGQFVLAAPAAQDVNQTFALAGVARVGDVMIGAASLCGEDTFDGAVLGVSVFAGMLDAMELGAACGRSCRARKPDGSCYAHMRVEEEQRIETNAASDMDFMLLPPPPPCARHIRLRVTSSSSAYDWCIQELVLFEQGAPEWVRVVISSNSSRICSHSDDGQHTALFALDGDSKPEDGTGSGGGEYYCSAANETRGWISIELEREVCIVGYAMMSLKNRSTHGLPSTWSLQGSEDGEEWRLLHRQAGVTWHQAEWKRFMLDATVPYLFVTNLFDTAKEFGHNTESRLYRWIDEDEGWVLDQEMPTRGGRAAEFFDIEGEHFLAISGTVDSTVIASARTNDGRSSDTQVASDVFRWTRNGFVLSDTLSTNVSLSMTYFSIGGEDYLVSADHRRVVQPGGAEDKWASILFKREKHSRDCENDVCPRTTLCGCRSCECGELIAGDAMAGGAGVSTDPSAAFDGDDSTAWAGDFSGWVATVEFLNSSKHLPTNSSMVALEYIMAGCVEGASVLGYSVLSATTECPYEWALQGSNNGVEWKELDHRTGQRCSEGSVKTFLLASESAAFSRFRWVFAPPVDVNNSYRLDRPVQVRELEIMFGNVANEALFSAHGTLRSFDFQPRGPPFSSVGRDTDGYPVRGYRTTEYEWVGAYGDFDLSLEMGTGLVPPGNCSVGGLVPHDELWADPLAPFGSCAAFSDLCDPAEFPVCFNGTGRAGLCSEGNASGIACDVDADCRDGGYCAIGRRYRYKVSFKRNVRLIHVRMRGCGWCGSMLRIRDSNGMVIAKRDMSAQGSCTDCLDFRIQVLRTGMTFYIEEDNAAPLSVRASISFDFEPESRWREHALLPTTHAQDFEFFRIKNESFLAVANFRDPETCYGSVSCVNPRGSIPLVADTFLPYNIDSYIYKYNDTSDAFDLAQSIKTRGAVDWEHFMLSGRHHLCVANSFDAQFSSSSTTSVVYAWNGSTFEELQHISTHGAKVCKYVQSAGRHFLLLANSYDGSRLDVESDMYTWDGSKFVFVGGLPSTGAASLEPFEINNALYIAVANRFNGSGFTLDSTVHRVHDAVRWRGAIEYSDAFLPSAGFVERSISDVSTLRDAQNSITVVIRPESDLPLGTIITISGLVGSQTPTGPLALSGSDSGVFRSAIGQFSSSSSELVLTTGELLPSSRAVEFTFTLTNGLIAQGSVQPRISSSGSALITPRPMDGLILEISESASPSFTAVHMSQTTSVTGALINILSLMFRASADLPASTLLVLSGLLHSPTASGDLTLTGEGVTYIASNATWDKTSGTLNMTINHLMVAFSTAEVSFTLSNPIKAQSVAFPTLSAIRPGALANLPARASQTGVFSGSSRPRFIFKEVADSHGIAGMSNTLFVTIQPSTPLWEGASIIIGNLLGGSQPDTFVDLSGQHKGRFIDSRGAWSSEGQTVTLAVGPNCAVSCGPGECAETTGTACEFPFRYKGVAYLTCIALDSLDGDRRWCGTRSSVSTPMRSNKAGWGYCECQRTIPDDSKTVFTFALENPLNRFVGSTPTIRSEDFNIPVRPMTGTSGALNPLVLGASRNNSALTLPAGVFVKSRSSVNITASQLTIELWLYREQGSNHSLVAIGSGIELRCTEKGLGLSLGGAAPHEVVLDATVRSAWCHVAVTWTADTSRVVWYVNGNPRIDVSSNAGYRNTSVTASGKVQIGAADSLTSVQVAMVRVWTAARNGNGGTSIASLYRKVFMPTSSPAALLLHYTFDPGASDVGLDSSTSGADLAIDLNTAGPSLVPLAPSTLSLEGLTYPGVTLNDLTSASIGTKPGGDVCLSIWWQTSQELGVGSLVTVTNLQNMQTIVPSLPLSSSGQEFAPAPYARWDAGAGSLSLELLAPVQAGGLINFTVTLINGMEAVQGWQVQVSIQDGTVLSYGDEFQTVGPTTAKGGVLAVFNASNASCATAAATLPYWANLTTTSTSGNGTGGVAENITCPVFSACMFSTAPPCACQQTCATGAFKRPASLVAGSQADLSQVASEWVSMMAIGDFTSVGATANEISVTLQPDRSVPAGSRLIISGLTGSLTEDRVAGQACAITDDCFISVSGKHVESLERLQGSWEQAAGRLSLTLLRVMNADEEFTIRFSLLNSIYEQAAVVPTVEVAGMVWFPATWMCGEVMRVRTDQILLLTRQVTESTCQPCRTNLVTVTTQPSVNLSIGDNISVANLTESLTQSGPVQLTGPDAFRFQSGLGTWDHAAGEMVLTLGLPLLKGQVVQVSFALHNGQDVQGPRVPVMKVQAAVHDESLHGPQEWVQADSVAFFSFGGAANTSENGESNSTGADPQRWLAGGWTTVSTWQSSPLVWLEKPDGTCCIGSCCPAHKCCSCSSLQSSGLDGFDVSGVYFEGSPCETVCDMDTSGGGWTLASVHAPGGREWAVHPNASDPEDLKALYDTPNMWEDPRVVFGDWLAPADDVRTWAFAGPAGDGKGAGEQVMITIEQGGELGAWEQGAGAGGQVLLETEGACLTSGMSLSSHFANLAWECNSSQLLLSDLNRSDASVDNRLLPDEKCAHACVIAGSSPLNETALLGSEHRRFLFFKAGLLNTSSEAVSLANATVSLANAKDRVYLSTELRRTVGDGVGLGVGCSREQEACGADIGTADAPGGGRRYAVWVRRVGRWEGSCRPPYYRVGSECQCCSCPLGQAHDGGKCVLCPAGRFKDSVGAGGCDACAGTAVLGEGRELCTRTMEVFASTRAEADAAVALQVEVSVQFEETGEWTKFLTMPPAEGPLAPSTSRRIVSSLAFVGTPISIRYRLPPRDNKAVWWPWELYVRPNGGQWFGTNSTLCPVDANCRNPLGCAGNVPASNCSSVYRTSPPVDLWPLAQALLTNSTR